METATPTTTVYPVVSEFEAVERVSEEWERSKTIGTLAAALAKAQKAIKHAAKDSSNPHFGSTYADLAAVIDAVRDPLADQGIARIQAVMSRGETQVGVRTMLVHESGEYVASTIWVSSKTPLSPQQVGSVITYLRRYSLSAAAGTAQADDDAEAATTRPAPAIAPPVASQAPPRVRPAPKPTPIASPAVPEVVTEIPLREMVVPDGQVAVYTFRGGRWVATSTEPRLTEKQQGRIKELQREAGVSEQEWPGKLSTYYGVTSSTQLSDRLASDLIERLEQACAIRNG